MANVKEVARYIIEVMGPMTTMKLQKLTYYCQSWSLAWDGEPLFDEDFQAWANGPVCPELFSEHRGEFKVFRDFLEEHSGYQFTNDQIETMQAVIDYYGEKSPSYLSELTHKERPWLEARGNIPLGEPSDNIISMESMQQYYGGLSN